MRLLLLCLFLASLLPCLSQEYYLFIGTYTNTGSKGIYVYRFNAATGKAAWVSNTDSAVNPSYLALARNGKHLYAVSEGGRTNSGSVSCYAFERSSGRLALVNTQPSGGDGPCYVSVSNNSKWVVVGNYSGGSVSAIPLKSDGSLLPSGQVVQHEGKGINPQRQEKPHVHAAVFSPAQDYLFVPDLGLDRVMIYRFNAASKKPLQEARQPYFASVPGSGPRHFIFHPSRPLAYFIEEMSGTVVACKYNRGRLSLLQRISSHPANFEGTIGSADIHISPDGKFLYASNRGDANTITVFSIDPDSGRLKVLGFQPTLGLRPRNFMIDPTGRYLLVANQETGNIVIFRRDASTGLLRETGEQIKVPSPVCLKMMR